MKFVCLSCETEITHELSADAVDICEEDGADLIPEGYAVQNEDWADDEWIINATSIINVYVTEDSSRTSGCCDLDGCDGSNLQCEKCGEYVATARYDCWLPKHVILAKLMTKVVV